MAWMGGQNDDAHTAAHHDADRVAEHAGPYLFSKAPDMPADVALVIAIDGLSGHRLGGIWHSALGQLEVELAGARRAE